MPWARKKSRISPRLIFWPSLHCTGFASPTDRRSSCPQESCCQLCWCPRSAGRDLEVCRGHVGDWSEYGLPSRSLHVLAGFDVVFLGCWPVFRVQHHWLAVLDPIAPSRVVDSTGRHVFKGYRKAISIRMCISSPSLGGLRAQARWQMSFGGPLAGGRSQRKPSEVFRSTASDMRSPRIPLVLGVSLPRVPTATLRLLCFAVRILRGVASARLPHRSARNYVRSGAGLAGASETSRV